MYGSEKVKKALLVLVKIYVRRCDITCPWPAHK